jgi:hypothetical protein
MYTTTFTAEIAQQHIQDLHREAGARRLAKLATRTTTRANRTRKSRNNFGWTTVQSWHVASAH